MRRIEVAPLADDLSFGARITGVDRQNVADEGVRQQLREIFETRGMIVFNDMEPSREMQVALSNVFGPLQDHPLKDVPRVDPDSMPGVVDFRYDSIAEANGEPLCGWVPWHFDACYAGELNRGGVLRAIEIPPEGGLTGFADGVQLYNAISPSLRAKFAGLKILYHPKMSFVHQRFGMPKTHRWTQLSDKVQALLRQVEDAPRSIHPAIWQRPSGEWVLHVSPWQAAGIHEHETPEGDALLEALCQEMYEKMTPYWHRWEPRDMLIWDNWRFVHCAGGYHPKYDRRVQRTTIKGDYGLGRFERDSGGKAVPAEMAM
jgi:taurine dioxygenase